MGRRGVSTLGLSRDEVPVDRWAGVGSVLPPLVGRGGMSSHGSFKG